CGTADELKQQDRGDVSRTTKILGQQETGRQGARDREKATPLPLEIIEDERDENFPPQLLGRSMLRPNMPKAGSRAGRQYLTLQPYGLVEAGSGFFAVFSAFSPPPT